MTVAVGYIRVSTAEQGASGLGLEAQRAAILEACKARGLELAGVHVDSTSSKARHRPVLEEAIAAAAAVRGVLVVAKLDRLARSLTDYAGLLGRAQRHGWALLALDTPDTSTPHGKAMQGVVAVFAELERELVSARTREALAAAKDRGVVLGRPVPRDAALEARMVTMQRRQRMTATAIAAQLNDEGVRGPDGGLWRRQSVSRVLRRHGIKLRPGPRPRRRTGSRRTMPRAGRRLAQTGPPGGLSTRGPLSRPGESTTEETCGRA